MLKRAILPANWLLAWRQWPSRAGTAPAALDSLQGQFDRIHLTLNGFDTIPLWAQKEGVDAYLPGHGEDYGAAGKLRGLLAERIDPELIYFCVDDDIRYPPDFSQRLEADLMLRPDALLGVHGSTFKPSFRSWRTDRNVHYFEHPRFRARRVDVVATCGCVFFPDRLQLNVADWPQKYSNCVDLYLALEALRQGVESWIGPRRWRWMKALDIAQGDSIFAALRQDDSLHTSLSRQLLRLKAKG